MQDWHIAHTWEPGSRPFVGLSHRVVHDNSDHATGVWGAFTESLYKNRRDSTQRSGNPFWTSQEEGVIHHQALSLDAPAGSVRAVPVSRRASMSMAIFQVSALLVV